MKPMLREQALPLTLTFLTFLLLCGLLFTAISLLNLLPTREKVAIVIRPQDILIGLTIYVKTAIDFAIFIGNLMQSNPGFKKRIAIEIGTACGNAFGTILVLFVWSFFREVPLLLAVMIILSSLVLLRMA